MSHVGGNMNRFAVHAIIIIIIFEWNRTLSTVPGQQQDLRFVYYKQKLLFDTCHFQFNLRELFIRHLFFAQCTNFCFFAFDRNFAWFIGSLGKCKLHFLVCHRIECEQNGIEWSQRFKERKRNVEKSICLTFSRNYFLLTFSKFDTLPSLDFRSRWEFLRLNIWFLFLKFRFDFFGAETLVWLIQTSFIFVAHLFHVGNKSLLFRPLLFRSRR